MLSCLLLKWNIPKRVAIIILSVEELFRDCFDQRPRRPRRSSSFLHHQCFVFRSFPFFSLNLLHLFALERCSLENPTRAFDHWPKGENFQPCRRFRRIDIFVREKLRLSSQDPSTNEQRVSRTWTLATETRTCPRSRGNYSKISPRVNVSEIYS